MIYAHQLHLIPRSFIHPAKRAFECQVSWIGGIMLISCCPIFSTISLTVTAVWQLFATCHFFIRHKTTCPLGCLSEILNFVSKRQSHCALLFIFTHPQEYWWYYFLRVPSFSLRRPPNSQHSFSGDYLSSFLALLLYLFWLHGTPLATP